MKALVQRVRRARVCVGEEDVGSIGSGLLILLGVRNGDGPAEVQYVAEKCANLRIFVDEQGRFNRSVLDAGGEALVVSQFTLYGDTRRGRRPSFTEAAAPAVAEPLYEAFVEALQKAGLHVETGRFGAMMDVESINEGPVTVMVERDGERA